jgi:hypothetical protein
MARALDYGRLKRDPKMEMEIIISNSYPHCHSSTFVIFYVWS